MKISEDFSIAKLLKGSLLGLTGLALFFSSIYIGFNNDSMWLCGFLIVGGLIAFGLGVLLVCRFFERK